MGRLQRFTIVAVAIAMLAAAAQAQAAATMTNPANGSVVALDRQARFDFRWTLPAGEFEPYVLTGDTPTFDPDTLAPYQPFCGFDEPGAVGFSCHGDDDARPIDPGTHYAIIQTTDASGQAQYVSPVSRFIVPVKSGLGCSPLQPGCHDTVIHNDYYRYGSIEYAHPHSRLLVNGWSNAPIVHLTYTIKRGHRVLKRVHDKAGTDTYFSYTSEISIYRLPGVRRGAKVRCTISANGGDGPRTRTVTVRAGAGPRRGAAVSH